MRNTRFNILAAKLAVFILLCAASMLLFMLGNLALASLAVAVNHSSFSDPGGEVSIPAAFAIGLLDLARVGALVALASVISRNLTGAIISIIVTLLVLVFAETQATMHQLAWAQSIAPGIAFDRLMGAAAGQDMQAAGGLWAPLAVLVGWLAIAFGIAAGLFLRQDLSRE